MADKTDLMTSFDKVNDLLNKIAPDGEIMDINPIAKIDEWIPTGWYLLNAAISGRDNAIWHRFTTRQEHPTCQAYC